jgi:uncharacterized protein (DUF2237 family)
METLEPINILGEPLVPCGMDPITGFFRDGACNTCQEDLGVHTVCIEASGDFLSYSKSVGNDLSTPMPEYGFKGLNPGDRWCLCASRWLQAYQANAAPRVHIMGTHIKTLEIVPLELLTSFAADLN